MCQCNKIVQGRPSAGCGLFEYVSEGVLWASESVNGCCSLHGLQDVHQLSGCRTSISVFPQTPSDQVQQSLVADGLWIQ